MDEDEDDEGEPEPSDAEDLDEDDDEDDDSGDGAGRGRKREGGPGGPAAKRSRFIDDIAEVEDEEDEDDALDSGDELEEAEALAAELGEGEDGGAAGERQRERLAAIARANEDAGARDEDLERFVKERYKDAAKRYRGTGAGDELEMERVTAVEKGALLPTPRDPKMWMVKTSGGKEREVVLCLLQKAAHMAAQGKPLRIQSAFSQAHLKGWVYVEAFSSSHVVHAVKGLRSVWGSKPPQLVPLKEMVPALAVSAELLAGQQAGEVRPGSWARMRGGTYKADLAQILEVEEAEGRAVVKIVPRLDINVIAAAERGEKYAGRRLRPPPKAFTQDVFVEARILVTERISRWGDLAVMGGMEFLGGCLLKTVNVKSLKTAGVAPSFEELERFRAAGESPLGFFFSRLRRGALKFGHKAARIRGYFGCLCAPWRQTLESSKSRGS